MPMFNTVSAIDDLLALAQEIVDEEQIPFPEGVRRALAELPRLTGDARQDVRYAPAPPVRPKPVTRWRPVDTPGDEPPATRRVADRPH